MDKVLIEAVKRLYRKELRDLEFQRDNRNPITPLGVADIERIDWLDLEIEEVGGILARLEKLG